MTASTIEREPAAGRGRQSIIMLFALLVALASVGPLGLMYAFPLTASFALREAHDGVRWTVRVVSAVGLTAEILMYAM